MVHSLAPDSETEPGMHWRQPLADMYSPARHDVTLAKEEPWMLGLRAPVAVFFCRVFLSFF
jgi:hypothetical protein